MTDFKKAGGFYHRGGKPYLSVTTILQIIAKPELMSWAAREAFWYTVKAENPNEQEASIAHLKARDSGANRGSTIHSLIEAYKTTGETIEGVPTPFQGYYNAFLKWMKKNTPDIIEQEKVIFNDNLNIAGTTDCIAKMNSKLYVVDFKTNKDGRIYPETGLQLSAYSYILRSMGIDITGLVAVGLGENGEYTERFFQEDFQTFLAAKTLWVWKNKEVVEKAGYK